MLPMPSRSQSGPPSRIDRPNPQNAAPPIQPSCVSFRLEQLLKLAHDVAANRERHRRGDERDAAGSEEPVLVHGCGILSGRGSRRSGQT